MKRALPALAFFALVAVLGSTEGNAAPRSGVQASKTSTRQNPAPTKARARKSQASRIAPLAGKAAAVGLTSVAGHSLASTPHKRETNAEARLIEVYRLIGSGKSAQALSQAEALVKAHPNFQLAQLVYGDLLAARTRPIRVVGDVPDTTARIAAPLLSDLRDESQARIKALRERPPPGTVPSQFLMLSSKNRHAIAVDASRSRLYLFENGVNGLQLLADYYISVGKSGIEKNAEGDLRTPLGVYFITNTLNPKSLKDYYGSGALPINYPNPLDARRGKTGSGIWLHGTPPTQFARAPKASDGCVVLANPDLEFIISTVEIRTTPVVIAQSIDWVAPPSVQMEASAFQAVLQGWRSSKSTGNLTRALSYYAADFNSESRDIKTYEPVIRKEIEKAQGREVALKDLSILRWREKNEDTMIVTFGEVVEGDIKGPKKRQYWLRQGNQWKIFFEGIIG